MKGRVYQKQNGALVDITPDALPIVAARNIGETVFSLAPLSDAGLHLLDGSVLSAGGMYAEAVAHFAALQADYPNLFVTESAWQTSVSTYGVCGKFVYDATAGTLRIPKVTGHIAGTIDPTAIGDLIEAGLPEIEGGITSVTGSGTITGAFTQTGTYNQTNGYSTTGSRATLNPFKFAASDSNPIYGNSNTVQPQAIKGFIYIVVANRTKTPIVADIDEIAADLQLKADVDLGNVTSAGQVRMAHAAMPSEQYELLTLPASGGTVTAPADGWMTFVGRSGPTQNTGYIGLAVQNGPSAWSFFGIADSSWPVTIPVKSGDIVYVNYNTTGSGSLHRLFFNYANGSAS